MTNKNLTNLYIVLDKSGSMAVCQAATEEGYNAFIDEQRKVKGECKVTLAQFDTRYQLTFQDRPVAEVPKLDLRPSGGTALLDAIGKTIADAGYHLRQQAEEDRPGLVIFAIVTDGEENSSREYALEKIHSMIDHQRKHYDWQFVFLGANQDAIQSGSSMGFSAAQSMTYDSTSHVGTRSVYTASSANVASMRNAVMDGAPIATASAALNYTDTQRAEAMGDEAEEEDVNKKATSTTSS